MPDSPTFRASRREILLAGAAAGASLLLPSVPRVARADGGSFVYTCNRQSALLMDPSQHQRVGYLTDFNGLGLAAPLARDMQVVVPWSGPAAPAYSDLAPSGSVPRLTAKVVGVIDKLSWGGGVGDAIQISAWVSQQSATQLKAIQQAALRTTAVSAFGYWIVDYNQETKVWYEQAYPLTPANPGGQLSGGASGLAVDLTGAPAAPGLNIMVYQVSLAIVPAFNRASTLQFATGLGAVSKQWGQFMAPVPPPTLHP